MTTSTLVDNAASAAILDAISAKRAGQALESDAIHRLVEDFIADRIPDYQMAAWLATVACRGLSLDETVALTRAYVAGGRKVDLRGVGRRVIDKHSTGGVGDKVTLVVAPLVAACGVAVAKMSGRGLEFAGGTVDKLEAIPGLRLDLGPDDICEMLARTGLALTGQSDDLAPGDMVTYGLRDVTATVDSIPLIAASIISKKVAVGADGLVLDVKTGAGALSPEPGSARRLAEAMVQLAHRFGLDCVAVVSDMSQPLGWAAGNRLEVREAIAVLKGEPVPGVRPLALEIGRLMLQMADPALPAAAARGQIEAALDSGAGYERFRAWAQAQGADPAGLDALEGQSGSPRKRVVLAQQDGWVQAVDPRAVGNAALRVGAGRLTLDAPVDHDAGVVVRRRVGDRVSAGEPVAELHYTDADPAAALALLSGAFRVGGAQPEPPPLIYEIIDPHNDPALDRGQHGGLTHG